MVISLIVICCWRHIICYHYNPTIILNILILSSRLQQPPSPPVRPVKYYLWPSWDGSHPGHSLFPPLVDGGDGSHREPAFLRRAAGMGIPAHNAQVWGLLLLPVQRAGWVVFMWVIMFNEGSWIFRRGRLQNCQDALTTLEVKITSVRSLSYI